VVNLHKTDFKIKCHRSRSLCLSRQDLWVFFILHCKNLYLLYGST